MRSLPIPTISALAVFDVCISRVRDPLLKAKFVGIRSDIHSREMEFISFASLPSGTLPVSHSTVGIVGGEELSSVYTDRMVKKGSPGRDIYNKLICSAPNGRCPLCGQGAVTTLDHYLPKKFYPALVVTPANLVPACSYCNTAKHEYTPPTRFDAPFHPYFDNIEDFRWLCAEILPSAPPAARFSIRNQPSNPVLSSRLNSHFNLLKLGVLYASNAAEDFEILKTQLEALHRSGGDHDVREYLQERATAYRHVRANSWQTALYEALSVDSWYCSGGFRW